MPLIHEINLCLPDLPDALAGLRIAQLSDLHVARPGRRHDRIAAALEHLQADLVFFTGDYISHPGQESASMGVMRRLCGYLHPRLGVFGVFGNHDTAKLRQAFRELPVRWLDNQVHHVPGLPLELWGVETDSRSDPDALALIAHRHSVPLPSHDAGRPVRVLLCHHPTYLPTAADLGVDLMFSGHTHGGQMRLPRAKALVNSTDLPAKLTSGLLRHRQTVCAVSRGLGEIHVPIRVFCPPHLPVYTLRRGARVGRDTYHVENVRPW